MLIVSSFNLEMLLNLIFLLNLANSRLFQSFKNLLAPGVIFCHLLLQLREASDHDDDHDDNNDDDDGGDDYDDDK